MNAGELIDYLSKFPNDSRVYIQSIIGDFVPLQTKDLTEKHLTNKQYKNTDKFGKTDIHINIPL